MNDDALAVAAALQRSADQVQRDLELPRRLEDIGDPVLVGSAALGVMVRRDIDITTSCGDLSRETQQAITAMAAALARHDRVRGVQIRDDTGAWNVDPEYPDGWFVGVQYRDQRNQEWTLDLWFVDEPDRQPDLQQLRRVLPALTDAHRRTILEIKRARSSRPEHPAGLSGRVYDAVLEHGVRTVEQFDRWCSAGG